MHGRYIMVHPRVRERIGHRRIDGEGVVLGQLAPAHDNGGVGKLVCAVVVVGRVGLLAALDAQTASCMDACGSIHRSRAR